MDKQNFKKMAKSVATGTVAGRSTDPAFYDMLNMLPNPDPILRQMGRAEEAYDAIMSDAHVIGELRSVRSGLLSYKRKVVAADGADESPLQLLALELCTDLMNRKPAPGMLWEDVIWNMYTSVLRGFKVHEADWQYIDGYMLPAAILDRPNRRFRYDTENNLRLLTKAASVNGEETVHEAYKWLVTRHMPSSVNPYGQALLSSCFWPYTFKHGGFKFLYQFCERHGLPWPVGKYPEGTSEPDQQKLLDSLLDMIASGAAVIPDGDKVDLITVSHSGELVQESLVNLCNREMSKALTSQTLATEMVNVGSNAASKTHSERQADVSESDRAVIESTINDLFANITLFNCGPDVLPPKLQLYKNKSVSKERADIWEIAARIGNPSKAAFHKEMNIPQAEDEDDRLVASDTQQNSQQQNFNAARNRLEFAQDKAIPATMVSAAVAQADAQIEQDLIEPIFQMLQEYEHQGKTLQNFLDDLPLLFSKLDTSELAGLNSQIIQLAMAEGMADA